MQSQETKKMRENVLQSMRELAKSGGSIGMAGPDILLGLVKHLEKHPSNWFSAGLQLYQAGYITYTHYQILMGKNKKDKK